MLCPFHTSDDNEFYTAISELQNDYTSFCNLEKLDALCFHPFRDEYKSKANFVDNFCDPDERVFKDIEQMPHDCKYFIEESFQKITKNVEFSLIHFNIRSLRKNFSDLQCTLSR